MPIYTYPYEKKGKTKYYYVLRHDGHMKKGKDFDSERKAKKAGELALMSLELELAEEKGKVYYKNIINPFLEHLESEVKMELRSTSSYIDYETTLRKFIEPHFESRDLQSLSKKDFDKWYETMFYMTKKDGELYKDEYLNKILNNFNVFLDYACENYGLKENLAKKLKKFKRVKQITIEEIFPSENKKAKAKALDNEQFKTLLHYVEDERDYLYLLVAYAGAFRKGEQIAIKETEIYFEHAGILLNHSITFKVTKEMREQGITYIDKQTLKTDGSASFVMFPDNVLALIKKRLTYLHSTLDYQPDFYFFNGESVPLSQNWANRMIQRYIKKANLELEKVGAELLPMVTIHSMRHSTASDLSDLVGRTEISAVDISKHLRHSKPDMTLNYTHQLNSKKTMVANTIGVMIDNIIKN